MNDGRRLETLLVQIKQLGELVSLARATAGQRGGRVHRRRRRATQLASGRRHVQLAPLLLVHHLVEHLDALLERPIGRGDGRGERGGARPNVLGVRVGRGLLADGRDAEANRQAAALRLERARRAVRVLDERVVLVLALGSRGPRLVLGESGRGGLLLVGGATRGGRCCRTALSELKTR